MFYKISQVKEAFFEMFYKPGVTIYPEGSPVPVKVRYAKKSAEDYSEEDQQQEYPVIAIWDFPPTISETFSQNGLIRVANERDPDENTGLNTHGTLFYEPIRLNFRFDVSFASKSYKHRVALEDYFYKHFLEDERWVLRRNVIDNEEYGEIVSLKFNVTEIPRTDGVHEVNVEMSFDAWVQVQDQVEVDLLQELNITVNPIAPPETE